MNNYLATYIYLLQLELKMHSNQGLYPEKEHEERLDSYLPQKNNNLRIFEDIKVASKRNTQPMFLVNLGSALKYVFDCS